MAADRAALLAVALCACASRPAATTMPCPELPAEVSPVFIALRGVEAPRGDRAHTRYAEVSALAWHGDALWLMPQYPARYASEGRAGALLSIPQARLEAYLDGRDSTPIEPARLSVDLGAAPSVEGFEGVEALVVEGDQVWAAVEVQESRERTSSFVIAGRVTAAGLTFGDARVALAPLTPLPNTGYEALLGTPQGLVAIFEANGAVIPGESSARVVSRDLQGDARPVTFPRLEYRVTDVSSLDAQGRFWAMNYYFPGDSFLYAGDAPFVDTVERLVELRWTPEGVTRTDRAPVALRRGNRPRNWEGLARWPGRGMLVATDEWPDTLLALVPVE